MLDIAICDDNVRELEHLGVLLDDFQKQRPQHDLRVRRFQSSYDLADCIRAGRCFHIYLVDVHMPRVDNLPAPAMIRSLDPDAALICISTLQNLGPASTSDLEVYLSKPISTGELFPALNRMAEKLRNRATRSLPVKTSQGLRTLPFHQIVCVRYRNHSVLFSMDDGEQIQSITLREPFSQITQPLLAEGRFVRVSSSCVVNMAFVDSISARDLVMRDGARLSIPRAGYSMLKRTFQDYSNRR